MTMLIFRRKLPMLLSGIELCITLSAITCKNFFQVQRKEKPFDQKLPSEYKHGRDQYNFSCEPFPQGQLPILRIQVCFSTRCVSDSSALPRKHCYKICRSLMMIIFIKNCCVLYEDTVSRIQIVIQPIFRHFVELISNQYLGSRIC